MSTVAWRIASRELAGGLRGFWIYVMCLVLGVWAIAAAGSTTASFQAGLAGQSRTLLGGDVVFTAAQRLATPDELAWISSLGIVSETINVDLMGEAGGVRRQVDVRAVDDRYPLIGAVGLSDSAMGLTEALAQDAEGRWGAAVSGSLLEAFGLRIGDRLRLGAIEVDIRSRLEAQPDRVGSPGAFGPAALIQVEALKAAGRLTNGQLFRSSYRVLLETPRSLESLEESLETEIGPGGLRLRGPQDAVDGLQDVLGMLNAFLAVIGIAALVAGGVGVAQATSSFLETRMESIAAFKALGASSDVIRTAYLIQLGALAAFGAVLGAGLGATTPYLLAIVAGDRLALPQALGVYPGPLLQAAVLGLLSAAVFAFPALGRARATKPASLFRLSSVDGRSRSPWFERSISILAGVALVAVAAGASPRPIVTISLLAGAAATYLLLLGIAQLIRAAARRGAHRAEGLRRLALANLGGPGSLAPTIAPALGLGIALLTLVAAVQANLLRQISETAPANAPALVFSQIPHDQTALFDDTVAAAGVAVDDAQMYRRVPFLLGRVTSLKGEPLDMNGVAPSEQWVVDGEIGLTFTDVMPTEAVLSEGDWWPKDYRGPQLVSVEGDAARGLGVGVGDTIGFRVFGREIEATVASLREVDWGGFGVNMAFILSPGQLEAARPYHVAIAQADLDVEGAVIEALAALPDIVVFQTRPALATAAELFGDIAIGVNAAAGVVTLAGLFVLIGAFAAMARKRRAEAALLKTFGATRSAVIGLYASEFALAGGVAALLGAAIGVFGAYPIVVGVFEAEWSFPIGTVLAVSSFAVAAAAIGGAAVGISTLSLKPAQVLRTA